MESPTFSKEGALTKMVFDMFANSVGLVLSTQKLFSINYPQFLKDTNIYFNLCFEDWLQLAEQAGLCLNKSKTLKVYFLAKWLICKFSSILDTRKPKSCLEWLQKGHNQSGLYQIYVAGLGRNIEVGLLCVVALPSL